MMGSGNDSQPFTETEVEMPSTVNGIGTMYYGKRNLMKEQAYCEKCNQYLELNSYQTRTWFVFVFIPLIPLGKKQIINYCPSCTYHRVMPFKKWEQLKAESIQAGMSQMKENEKDPDACLNMHSTLDAFGSREEAKSLADIMENRFPDNFDIQMYLGTFYERIQENLPSDTCFARALEINPEDSSAKRAVGIGAVNMGDLQRGRELILSMEESAQTADVIYTLAKGYQDQEKHKEALEIFQILIERFPSLAQTDKDLRKLIQQSEKFAGQSESILPTKRFAWGKWLFWGAIATLIFGGVGLVDWHLGNSQELHIINPFEQEARITWGKNEVTVPAQKRKTVDISEGEYKLTVEVKGLESETVPVRIENSFFQRMAQDSTFILNVGGGSLILWEKIVYRRRQSPNDPPNPYKVHLGKKFQAFRGIDYPFKTAPETIKIEGSSATKYAISIWPVAPVNAIGYLHKNMPTLVFDYAQKHLLTSSSPSLLLDSYFDLCSQEDKLDRCVKTLEKRLETRPVDVLWHKFYQDTLIYLRREMDLIKKYDEFSQKNPKNSEFIFLRGRVELEAKKALSFFDKAIELNNQNPHPWEEKAYYEQGQGNFEAAGEYARKALSLQSNLELSQDLLYDTRFLAEERNQLIKETRETFQANGMDYTSLARLLQLYVFENQKEEAKQVLNDYQNAILQKMPEDTYELVPLTNMRLAYLQGDIDQYAQLAASLRNPSYSNILGRALLEQGQILKAEQHFQESSDGYDRLLLSLFWEKEGNEDLASQWLSSAQDWFAEASLKGKRVIPLLSGEVKNAREYIGDLSLGAKYHSVLLLACSSIYPEERKNLLDLSKKLNYKVEYPYIVVQEITHWMENK